MNSPSVHSHLEHATWFDGLAQKSNLEQTAFMKQAFDLSEHTSTGEHIYNPYHTVYMLEDALFEVVGLNGADVDTWAVNKQGQQKLVSKKGVNKKGLANKVNEKSVNKKG